MGRGAYAVKQDTIPVRLWLCRYTRSECLLIHSVVLTSQDIHWKTQPNRLKKKHLLWKMYNLNIQVEKSKIFSKKQSRFTFFHTNDLNKTKQFIGHRFILFLFCIFFFNVLYTMIWPQGCDWKWNYTRTINSSKRNAKKRKRDAHALRQSGRMQVWFKAKNIRCPTGSSREPDSRWLEISQFVFAFAR